MEKDSNNYKIPETLATVKLNLIYCNGILFGLRRNKRIFRYRREGSKI